MLKQLKFLSILSIITFNILSMDKDKINQEKPLECTKLLPDLQKLIVQYASVDWKIHKIIDAHHNKIDQISVTADGKLLLSSSWDGTAKLWDSATDKLKSYLPDTDNTWINSVDKEYDDQAKKQNYKTFSAISNDGLKKIVAPIGDFIIVHFDHGHGKADYISEIYGIFNATALTFSNDSKYLAIGDDSKLKIFKVGIKDENPIPYHGIDISVAVELLTHDHNIKAIIPYQDNNFIISCENGLSIVTLKENVAGIDLQYDPISKVISQKLAISNNNKYLAFLHETENNKQIISIMDLVSKKIIENLEQDHKANAFALSNDGQYLTIGLSPNEKTEKTLCNVISRESNLSNFMNFKIWNNELKEYTQNKTFDGDCNSIIFSPNGTDLFIGLENGKILHLKRVLEK